VKFANRIHKSVGGDIFEIQPVKPYPRDYDATVEHGSRSDQNLLVGIRFLGKDHCAIRGRDVKTAQNRVSEWLLKIGVTKQGAE
jgi:hypothetical protein